MFEKIGFSNIVKNSTKGDFFKFYTHGQAVNVANRLILLKKTMTLKNMFQKL